jgi:hypothetical protein
MSECWDDGGLRGYFDRELPAEDLTRIAAHLGACAECHTRYNELAARAARVSGMMGALVVNEPARPVEMPKRGWKMPAAVASMGLAAAAALAFVAVPRPVKPPDPVATPHVKHVDRPIVAETPAPAPAEAKQPAAAKIARAKVQRTQQKPQPEYFLALDDEPIDAGIVMRVALDSTASVQADVVFDAAGHPRAIRPVK